ncbi:MAG: hypothetical protein K2X93_23090 [Candidatus Obscuribacterales bacterium]|nr:hypothetical protein [Candidatus Obscuribacterales bacterium]
MRTRKGAALGLVAALGFALVLIAMAFFVISLYFGGARETRNATDAGALNVGKKSLTVTVKSEGGDEDQFSDVADHNNEFGLSNINRVWGKALWTAINAVDIQKRGAENGSTSSHSSSMYQAAKQISDRLADKLNKPDNLYPFFEQVATINSVRMLGETARAKVQPGNNWKSSLMERAEESNLVINSDQLPGVVTLNTLGSVADKGGHDCLPGYKGVNVYGRDYWFVPFKFNERPRLESKDHFTQNQLISAALPGWSNPVPNAFSIESKTIGGATANQRAMSYVKANPMTNYDMTIPHAFIRIKFVKNDVKWFLNMIPYPPDSDYGFGPVPETVSRFIPYVPGCGTGQVSTQMANEYIPNTVFKCMFPLPQPQHPDVLTTLLQRCREIDPSYTMIKLTGILNAAIVTGDGNYFIVPAPGGSLVCVPESAVTSVAPWIKKSAGPDSEETTLVNELWPPYTYPNYVTAWTVECASLFGSTGYGVFSFTDADGTICWYPGTGYDGFLGELVIDRQTNVRLFGACSCGL